MSNKFTPASGDLVEKDGKLLIEIPATLETYEIKDLHLYANNYGQNIVIHKPTGNTIKLCDRDYKILEQKIKTLQNVEHPKHYTQGGIECIDAMIAAYGDTAVMDFCKCNAFKYLFRMDNKNNPLEDVKKAIWYLNKWTELFNK